jgi:hypothetical protein
MIAFVRSDNTIAGGCYADSSNVIRTLTRIPDGTTPCYIDDTQYPNVWADSSEYTIENGVPMFTPIPDATKLANAQTAQIALINAGLSQTLLGGFTSKSTGHAYVTTTNGQTNMEGDLKRFELDPTLTSLQFYTVDMGWIAHNHTDLQNAFLDGGKWKDAQYAQAQTLIGQVKSATTVGVVNAIVWSPATY